MRPLWALRVGGGLPFVLLALAACSPALPVGTTAGTTSGGTTGAGASSGTAGSGTSSPSSTSTGGTSTSTGSAGWTNGGTGGTTGTGQPDAGVCPCPKNQYCDPLDGGVCLVCVSDADCGGRFPVCDIDRRSINFGLCVACTAAESDCAAGFVCDEISNNPLFESCVADCRKSTAAAPCPGNPILDDWQHCDQSTGICLAGCTHASDCAPEEPFCNDAGGCVACLGPQDCPFFNPGCHGGACGFCLQTSECPPAQVCSSDRCMCAAASQCGIDAPVCEFRSETAMLGSCGCGSSFDCAPSGRVCEPAYESYTSVAGACLPSCVDGGTDCLLQVPPFNYCNVSTGICATCSNDTQCQGDAGLIGAHCLDGGTCGCFSMDDCPSGAACDPFLRQCAPSCAQAPGQCAWGTVCNPQSGLCVQCLQDSDCANEAPVYPYCSNDVDAGTSCVACLDPTDCPSDKLGCSSRTFQCGSCERNADCPAAYPHCLGPPAGFCA